MSKGKMLVIYFGPWSLAWNTHKGFVAAASPYHVQMSTALIWSAMLFFQCQVKAEGEHIPRNVIIVSGIEVFGFMKIEIMSYRSPKNARL